MIFWIIGTTIMFAVIIHAIIQLIKDRKKDCKQKDF